MKKVILSLGILLFTCSGVCGAEIRKPAVAGGFYPADKKKLEESINRFLSKTGEARVAGKIIAIIVPHAGYVYSGQVAAHAFKELEGKDINTAVLVCNSHKRYFTGIGIYGGDGWETPIGTVKIDKELADKLVNSDPDIRYNSRAHSGDHTLEVEIPFLQTVLKDEFKIVPILFGNTSRDSYKRLAESLAKNLGDADIVIVSTDMSHYPGYEDANRIDKKTMTYMEKPDIEKLEKHLVDIKNKEISGEETLCCGIDGIKTLMELRNILGNTEFKSLKYANSGDAPIIGDKKRVVGYASAVVYIPEEPNNTEEITMSEAYLNPQERQKLLTIARASIVEAVTGEKQPEVEVTEDTLEAKSGAFVTIKKHGNLRGCIGYIIAVKPLYQTVQEVARSAALNDPRFSPVSEKELDDLEVEVSALTPLKKIEDVEKIEVGKHGILMKKGFRSGLLLPQVATEYGWDRETFLEHTCGKAGLPKDAWKDQATEIYIFSAEVFGEN